MNNKRIISLLLVLIFVCIMFMLMNKKNESFNQPLLNNSNTFRRHLREAIANQLDIDIERIDHLQIDPANGTVTFVISNLNLHGNNNFHSVYALKQRMQDNMASKTLTFTPASGSPLNLRGTIELIDNTESRSGSGSKTGETFKDEGKYVDNYDPTFDNLPLAKSAHYLMDRYKHAPTDEKLNGFIRIDYDENMRLKAINEQDACL